MLIIGSGIAGLTAAISARQSGVSVILVSKGAGTYAISSGCIDLLGYVANKNGTEAVEAPLSALPLLPKDHPYSLLGKDAVLQAISFFSDILERQKAPYTAGKTEEGAPKNTLLPTILGTVKPSYLIPKTHDSTPLFNGKKILVAGVSGLRDMSPKLCRDGLRRQAGLGDKEMDTVLLPAPLNGLHRSLSTLDLARFVDTKEGETWLETSLGRLAPLYDCVLLPPILGTKNGGEPAERLEKRLGTRLLELLSIPPGVGGIRLHKALMQEARDLGIRFLENVDISAAVLSGSTATCVTTQGTSPERLLASSFILATGGILGGGLTSYPDRIEEKIFRLPVDAPSGLSRTNAHIFDQHPVQSVGVRVDAHLRPAEKDTCLLNNVFLAGRILGGYDHGHEKSGHGVAITTGYMAGIFAARHAKESHGV